MAIKGLAKILMALRELAQISHELMFHTEPRFCSKRDNNRAPMIEKMRQMSNSSWIQIYFKGYFGGGID